MSRRDVFLIAGLASISKSALGYARPRPRFLIGDGLHPKGADVFEVQYHPSGVGFQAQFFRDGDLVAHADLPQDITVGQRCSVVQPDANRKPMPKTALKDTEDKSPHRQSVSLTEEQHRQLAEIARKNRVSVAWVIREAIDRLLKDDMPLLHVGKE